MQGQLSDVGSFGQSERDDCLGSSALAPGQVGLACDAVNIVTLVIFLLKQQVARFSVLTWPVRVGPRCRHSGSRYHSPTACPIRKTITLVECVVLLQTATRVVGWRRTSSSARTSSLRCWCSRKLTRSAWKPTRRCWPAPRAPHGMLAGSPSDICDMGAFLFIFFYNRAFQGHAKRAGSPSTLRTSGLESSRQLRRRSRRLGQA